MSRLRTVALLAREPGLAALHELLERPDIELKAVFTHLRLPEDEGGGVRPEVPEFRRLCKAAEVPLILSDPPAAKDIGPDLPLTGELDVLISDAWDYGVGQEVLGRFRLGGINLQGEDLRRQGGATAVQRAIDEARAREPAAAS